VIHQLTINHQLVVPPRLTWWHWLYLWDKYNITISAGILIPGSAKFHEQSARSALIIEKLPLHFYSLEILTNIHQNYLALQTYSVKSAELWTLMLALSIKIMPCYKMLKQAAALHFLTPLFSYTRAWHHPLSSGS